MITAMYEGTYSAGPDKSFVPVDPEKPADNGALKLAIQPYLIRDPEFTALIDAGPGPFGALDHHSMRLANLRREGLSPDDIEHVFCTHLHIDHIGGLLHNSYQSLQLSFPNARIWMSGREWQEVLDKPDRQTNPELGDWAAFLHEHGNLKFLEDAHPLPQGIRMQTIGGHTPDHQAVFYEKPGLKAMMLGDVLARPETINRRFIARFDHDGKKSRELRSKYLQKAYEQNYFVLTYHGLTSAIVSLQEFDPKKGYELQYITNETIGSHPGKDS